MFISLTLTLVLLLGGVGAAGAGPVQTNDAATGSEQTTPPPDNDARAHIIDIG